MALDTSTVARVVVPILVKSGHNLPFCSVACLRSPFRFHALRNSLNAKIEPFLTAWTTRSTLGTYSFSNTGAKGAGASGAEMGSLVAQAG